MSLCSALRASSFPMPQDYAPAKARKPRPHAIILDRDSALEYTTLIVQSPTIDSRAVSPDFNSRPVSLVSDCSSSDSVAVGFGRKRHFVLPTMPAPAHNVTQSTIVDFGRKKRHSISVPPSSSITLTRKHENRRSLPIVLIPRDGLFPPDVKRELDRRISLPPSNETTINQRTSSILGLTRRAPKPLLLPRQVKLRSSLTGRVKRTVIGRLSSVVSFRVVALVVSRLSAIRRLRLRPLSLGRLASVDDEMERALEEGFIKQLKNLHHLYCYLRAIARL
ncbi:hypothetical protein GGX14DRAFT_642148 [Mycena pura]|uniref:Uncharacterized protein n=1 Tax=Mycena pura TaxID=153505 RepID=A0AAD6YQ45_9AGAR|nr:hypothetical protein GGX14DRAFT_642148 [Mycena pura]